MTLAVPGVKEVTLKVPTQESRLVGLGWSQKGGHLVSPWAHDQELEIKCSGTPDAWLKEGSQRGHTAKSFDVLAVERRPKGHAAGVQGGCGEGWSAPWARISGLPKLRDTCPSPKPGEVAPCPGW